MRTKISASCAAVLGLLMAIGTPTIAPADETTALDPQFQAVVDAYQRDYPSLSENEALRAATEQVDRIHLLEQLQTENPAGFGGSWYDPLTNVQHVNTVGDAAVGRARDLGAENGLTVVTHPVSHSLTELVAIAAAINAGEHPVLGDEAIGAAAPDPVANKVTVTLPAAELSGLDTESTRLEPVIVLVEGEVRGSVPEACADRVNCGTPLRGGIVIRNHQATVFCSLGYTARASDGSLWAVTAGHCGRSGGGVGVQWDHGNTYIGPAVEGRDSGNVDVARIHLTNPYFQTGGWMFDLYNPNVPAALHYAITARGTIQAGDGACLNAMHSGTGNCGTIIRSFGPRGMPSITFDGCPGDSGGTWFAVASYGDRIGYGVHHGQPPNTAPTCHDHNASDSIFTAIPDLNAHWDATAAATIRIEQR